MRRVLPVPLLAALVALAGCGGPKTYSISGTVKRGGEKLTWSNGGTLLVIFMPEDETKTDRYPARETDLAGSTYKVTGIPPGRYKVAVQQFFPSEKTNYNDALGGRYDPGHTDLVYEVTGDNQVIDIEIPKAEEREGGRRKR